MKTAKFKNLKICLLLGLCLTTAARAQEPWPPACGNGTLWHESVMPAGVVASNYSSIPFAANRSSYATGGSKTLYTNEELEAQGIQPGSMVRTLGVWLRGDASQTIYGAKIYLGNSNASILMNNTDTAIVNEMTLVLTRDTLVLSPGLNRLWLDSTFTYDGSTGLTAAFVRTESLPASFYLAHTSNGRTFYYYKNAGSTRGTGWTSGRVCVEIGACTPPPYCQTPEEATVTGVTDNMAAVAWQAYGDSCQTRIGVRGYDGVWQYGTASLTGDTLTGLLPDTYYQMQARSLCGNDTTEWGDTLFFHTYGSYPTGGCQPTTATLAEGTAWTGYLPFGSRTSTLTRGGSWNLYTRQELMAEGVYPGSDITAVALYADRDDTLGRVRVYMCETPLNAMAGRSDSTALSQMTIVADMPTWHAAAGWSQLTLQTPFHYTGVNNLMVAFVRDSSGATGCRYRCLSSGRSVYFNGSRTSCSMAYQRLNLRMEACARTPLCAPPDSLTASATDSSVTLRWPDTAGRWEAVLCPRGGAPQTALRHIMTDSNTATFQTLPSATHYTLYARRVCGTGDTGMWSRPCEAQTECGTLTVPYSNTIDNADAAGECLQLYGRDKYTTEYSVSGGLFTTGAIIVYDEEAPVVLPAFDKPVNQLHLHHDLYVWDDMSVVYGVMTNAQDPATFVAVDTLPVTYRLAQTQHVETDFRHYSGPAGRIALKVLQQADGSTQMVIDNLVVDTLQECYAPIALLADSVTASTANLTWRNHIAPSTGYEVVCIGGGDTLHGWTATPNWQPTSLHAGAVYTWRVRAVCQTGDTGVWSAEAQFATPCGTINYLPYLTTTTIAYEGVWNDPPHCWTAIEQEGTHYVVSPAIDTTVIPLDNLRIDFDLTGSCEVGMTDNVGDSFTPMQPIQEAGRHRTYYLYGQVGSHIVIKKTNETGLFYVENLVLRAADCQPVTALTATDATDTTLTIDWESHGPATQWEVRYADGDGSHQVTTTNKPCRITGLTPYTTYRIQVRAICNEGDSSRCLVTLLAKTLPDSLHHTEQVAIGDTADATTSIAVPIDRFDQHSYTQNIFPAEMIGRAGWIDTLWFYCHYAGANAEDTAVRVYMGHTARNSVQSAHDWVSEDSLTLVRRAHNLAVGHTGWYPIALDTMFYYNGVDNLAVCIGRSSDQYSYGHLHKVLHMNRTTCLSRYHASYESYAYPPTGSTNGTRYSELPLTRLSMMTENPTLYHATAASSNAALGTAWIVTTDSTTCQDSLFEEGTTLLFHAVARDNMDSHFTGWSDGDTNNPRQVVLTQDTLLTAYFSKTCRLSVANADGMLAPIKIYTEDDTSEVWYGSHDFDYGTAVVVEAEADGMTAYGHVLFDYWNDDNTDNPRHIVLTQDTTFTAHYRMAGWRAAALSNDTVLGRVYVNDVASSELPDQHAEGYFREGSLISFRAVPNRLADGSMARFVRWSNGTTHNICLVTLTHDTVLTAYFELDTATQGILTTQAEAVRVYPNPAHDHLTVETPAGENVITLLDMSGRVLLTQRTSQRRWTTILDQRHHGVLFVQVAGPWGTTTHKILIAD